LQSGDQATAGVAPLVGSLIREQETEVLRDWRDAQRSVIRPDYLEGEEFLEQTRALLREVTDVLSAGPSDDLAGTEWEQVRGLLGAISRAWAYQGSGSSETATFVLSLKRGIFAQIRARQAADSETMIEQTWFVNQLIDQLALYTTEVHQQGREEVIIRQQRELMELSTPVVQLWEGIVVLPLIGTLDSARTQLVMESLLEMIVETGSTIAIIDITGVPAVDTLVAQHLLKTVAAARLMGADCVISGISPQIAQTIVHLGVHLGDVSTKASLAAAFALALRRRGLTIEPASSDVRRP
jgi:rsbT co-antagonist protein RsbR